MDKAKQFITRLIINPIVAIPTIPDRLFNISIFAGIIFTLFGALISGYNTSYARVSFESEILDKFFTSLAGDPLLWNLIILMSIVVLFFITSKSIVGDILWPRIGAASIPCIIFILIFIIGEEVIKPAFSSIREVPRIREPAMISLFRTWFGKEALPGDETAMPSGNIMRQSALFYLCNWAIFSVNARKLIPHPFLIVVFIINISGFFIVVFERYYSGYHSSIDIAIGVGVGTIMLWILLLPIFSMFKIRGKHIERIYLSTLAATTVVIYMSVIGYSKNVALLTNVFAFIIIYLSAINVFFPLFNINNVKWIRRDIFNRNNGKNRFS